MLNIFCFVETFKKDMIKKKSIRINITLECIECRNSKEKKKFGVSRYLTNKNRRNTQEKLELSKYCKYCKKHVVHKEIK